MENDQKVIKAEEIKNLDEEIDNLYLVEEKPEDLIEKPENLPEEIKQTKEPEEETKELPKFAKKRKKPRNYIINLMRCRGELDLLKLIIELNADKGWKVRNILCLKLYIGNYTKCY